MMNIARHDIDSMLERGAAELRRRVPDASRLTDNDFLHVADMFDLPLDERVTNCPVRRVLFVRAYRAEENVDFTLLHSLVWQRYEMLGALAA